MPVFRAGVELVSVDITALDNNGRQVTDLTAAELAVEIDGDKRQVSTVEYIRSADPLRVIGAPRKVEAPDETFSSSNAKGAPSGRLIVLLIDQGNIRTGAARSSMNSAKKFVDTLTPEDRVSVVAVPSPGELVDFTHRSRQGARGAAAGGRHCRHVEVALQPVDHRGDGHLHRTPTRSWRAKVIIRECAGAAAASELERCEREVEQDAAEIVIEIRRRTQDSINGMRAVFKGLGAVEGPKSVVLISEGFIFEGLGSETDELAAIAADSRATLDVLLLDVPQFDATQSRRPTTPREDRNLQVTGLEQLAGAARGELYRINVTADYAFDRISRSLDGYYLLGVESRPDDRNGRRHRIGVKTTRRGVTIRSRRSFVTAMSAKATTPADAVPRAIRSPLPINDLPLKISTWTYKEPGSGKCACSSRAEVERLLDQSLDYTVGMAIVNKQGRGFSPPVETRKLVEKSGDPGTAVFSGILMVEPGEYKVILSMADSEGRVGSVSRAVTAFQMDGPGISMGDLLLGGYAGGAKAVLEPIIEPAVAGAMVALMEAYSPSLAPNSGGTSGFNDLEATLEILSSENSPPLATVPMRVGAGPSAEVATVSAQFNTSSLPPGRYLARGTLRQGGKAQGHMIRPFRVVVDDAGGTAGAPAAAGVMPNEMVLVLLGGLSNFDRKELLTPAMLTSMFALADARAAGSKAAVKEARGGDLGAAAMTALGEGDQVAGDVPERPRALPGVAARSRRHAVPELDANGADVHAVAACSSARRSRKPTATRKRRACCRACIATPPNAAIARIAGEEWIKAGQPALAIAPLELAVQQPNADARAKKLLGIAYVLGGRQPQMPSRC